MRVQLPLGAAVVIVMGSFVVAAGQQAASTDAPAGARLLLHVKGVGVQIYGCKADASGTAAWTLTGPEAELLDETSGAEVGQHAAGPMWRYKDGSMVTGEVLAKAAAPEAGAVPWLLLKARSRAGEGLMAKVAFIRRLGTKGGVAPAEGCDTTHVGDSVRVDYAATYDFYAER